MTLLPLADALDHVLGLGEVLPAAPRPLADALGCVLAQDVTSEELVPPFDNSAMDGFAVRAADVAGATPGEPVVLRVLATTLAGMPPGPAVEAGTAVRIMTGAPMPPGADAVVMVERSAPVGEDRVALDLAVTVGQHVRPAGDDMRPGDVVLRTGAALGPGHLAVLATLGWTTPRCTRPVRLVTFSTGDELVEGPVALAPGQIRDSNRIAIASLARQAGAEVTDLGIVADDEDAIADAVGEAVAAHDLVVTTGGVSMGDVDLVKVVLDRLGDLRWMQVAIRPAKPLAAGTVARADGTAVPVLGLPGNPVSCMVSFELFARPLVRRLAGHPPGRWARPRLPARAAAPFTRRPDGKIHLVRATTTVDGSGLVAHPLTGQGSHQLATMARADALVELPDGDGVPAGGTVQVRPLGP